MSLKTQNVFYKDNKHRNCLIRDLLKIALHSFPKNNSFIQLYKKNKKVAELNSE